MTETRGAREKDKKDSGRREENHEVPKKGPNGESWLQWISLIQRFFFNFIEISLTNKIVIYLMCASDPRFFSRQSAFSYKW